MPSLSTIKLSKPVVLIGMMGVGKTHIGRVLARELEIDFYDSDDEIVASAGQSIPAIFEYYGEQAFRDLEKKVIKRLCLNAKCVISTGGGCITSPETLKMLKRDSYLIWLKSDVETLLERTSRRKTRPLLQNDNPKETLERLYKDREHLYAQAHFQIDTNEDGNKTTHEILEYLTTVV